MALRVCFRRSPVARIHQNWEQSTSVKPYTYRDKMRDVLLSPSPRTRPAESSWVTLEYEEQWKMPVPKVAEKEHTLAPYRPRGTDLLTPLKPTDQFSHFPPPRPVDPHGLTAVPRQHRRHAKVPQWWVSHGDQLGIQGSLPQQPPGQATGPNDGWYRGFAILPARPQPVANVVRRALAMGTVAAPEHALRSGVHRQITMSEFIKGPHREGDGAAAAAAAAVQQGVTVDAPEIVVATRTLAEVTAYDPVTQTGILSIPPRGRVASTSYSGVAIPPPTTGAVSIASPSTSHPPPPVMFDTSSVDPDVRSRLTVGTLVTTTVVVRGVPAPHKLQGFGLRASQRLFADSSDVTRLATLPSLVRASWLAGATPYLYASDVKGVEVAADNVAKGRWRGVAVGGVGAAKLRVDYDAVGAVSSDGVPVTMCGVGMSRGARAVLGAAGRDWEVGRFGCDSAGHPLSRGVVRRAKEGAVGEAPRATQWGARPLTTRSEWVTSLLGARGEVERGVSGYAG